MSSNRTTTQMFQSENTWLTLLNVLFMCHKKKTARHVKIPQVFSNLLGNQMSRVSR